MLLFEWKSAHESDQKKRFNNACRMKLEVVSFETAGFTRGFPLFLADNIMKEIGYPSRSQ